MKWALLFVLNGCATVTPVRASFTPTALSPSDLEGRWYVVVSNFPRWSREDLSDPTFNYAWRGGAVLADQVAARVKGGGEDLINGIDTQHPTVPTHFTWRGVGILSLFTSEWDLVALDPRGRWAVVYFSSTLATPEGVDLISRTPAMSEKDVRAVLALIRTDPFLKSRAGALFHVSHGGSKAGFALEP